MDPIYQKAHELAELILRSEQYQALRRAEAKVEQTPGVKELVDRFNRLSETIRDKESKVQPVEPEEKHELMRLREQIASNEVLQELLRAQTEYAMIWNRVSSILRARLERQPEKESAGS